MARANGEGSEPRRRRDGLYQSNYTIYVDGVPKLKSVYARNKSECRRKLREAIVARDGGLAVDPKNLTVATYLERWLEDSVKGSVKVRTYDDYRYCVDKHIAPELGRLKLDKLNAIHIRNTSRCGTRSPEITSPRL